MYNNNKQNARNLRTAVKSENIGLIRAMLQKGIDINLKDSSGNTALHYAVYKRSLNVTKFLLDNKADPNIQNKSGETPLHVAVCYELPLRFIRRLVNAGAKANINSIQDEYPIYFLLIDSNDFAQKLEVLLQAGADVERRDRDGNTYLGTIFDFQEVTEEYRNNLDLLVHHVGADIHTLNAYGDTLLHITVGSLNNVYSNFKVDYLIEHGLSTEARNLRRETPLLCAALYGCNEGFFYLLEKNANIMARDNENNTALHCAVLGNSLEIVRFLVENHPEMIDMQNTNGLTPLQLAMREVNNNKKVKPEIVQMLGGEMVNQPRGFVEMENARRGNNRFNQFIEMLNARMGNNQFSGREQQN